MIEDGDKLEVSRPLSIPCANRPIGILLGILICGVYWSRYSGPGNDPPGMNHSRNPGEDPEADVDQHVCPTSSFHKYRDRWNEYCQKI